MTERPGDVISSGRDPDRPSRPPRLPRRWRLAAAVVLLIGGGITAGVLLVGRPAPRPHAGLPHAAHSQVAHAILHGSRAGPDVTSGTVLLLDGADLRKLSVTGRAPVRLRWPATVHGLPGQGSVGSNSAEQVVEPVSGGFVALLASETGCCRPAVGDVFFIPVTARGAAAPRLIAHANYLAVAPGGRDIWVQQASPPGHLPGDAWLIDRSGRRLSSVLRLRRQILLTATVRGLLTGSEHGGGARLISTTNGATLSMRVPPGALIAAVSADDVAWQSPPCRRLACPLHVTSLLTGADTVIALPPDTQTNGQPGAFDQKNKRIALALDTIGRKHQRAATHIYIIDIGRRRVTQLPGGPLPLTQAATDRGAIVAGFSGFNSVSWSDGPELWIVASDSTGFQAAYWPGSGPLHVLSPQAGEVFMFAVSAAGAAPG
ncbi:MAG TPA: hypothetical protein VK162_26210 [Streptosporangiaceae bacterium]|nr:hypothetical protein [Streptosporangiaceae bacterium]